LPDVPYIVGIAPVATRGRWIGRSGGEAEGEVSARGFFARGQAMPRAVAGAPSIAHAMARTRPRPKKFTAPRRLQRLLER
jgi:hypothetical protein